MFVDPLTFIDIDIVVVNFTKAVRKAFVGFAKRTLELNTG